MKALAGLRVCVHDRPARRAPERSVDDQLRERPVKRQVRSLAGGNLLHRRRWRVECYPATALQLGAVSKSVKIRR